MEAFHENQDNRQIPWTFTDILVVFGFTFFSVAIVSRLAVSYLPSTNLGAGEYLEVIVVFVSTMVQNLLLLGLSFLVVKSKYQFSLYSNFFRIKHGKRILVVLNGIFGGLGIFVVITLINTLLVPILMYFLKYTPPQQEIVQLLLKTQSEGFFFAYAVMIVLVAPIVEETFFRGLVYSYLRDHYGVKIGSIVSAFLFGIMHQNAWAFMGTFLLGLGLAYLFEKSQTLWTNILAHMVWNGVVTFLLFFYWKLGITLN